MKKFQHVQAYKRRWATTARHLGKQSRNFKTAIDFESDDSEQECDMTVLSNPEAVANLYNMGAGTASSTAANTINSDLDSDEAHDSEADWDLINRHVTVSSDSESDTDCFEDELALWATEYQIKQNAVDRLLKLMKKFFHLDLPSTARTLLNTAKEVDIMAKSGMEYHYFGLASELLKHFKMYPLHKRTQVNAIEVSLNVDGLPLFRSSSVTLWPVLCAIVNIKPAVVFPVALTCGTTKPTDLEFLMETILDLKTILEKGLQDGDETFQVILRCIVCDAPARAMVKKMKLFAGYSGCDKCCQRGEHFGRITYQEVENLTPRTDASFRSQTYEEHHHSDSPSPFCLLPNDMVKGFPIDYMHQVCLGTMKRLLLVWMRGKREVRLSANLIQQISERLQGMRQVFPSTFSRKPRSLKEVDRWKATEFRQFLLYTGKVALRGILRPDLYDHFMTLSVAVSILVSPKLAENRMIDYAQQLLVHFVTQGRNLYGVEFLVYNVHSSLHLAEEVREYGSLDACAAFLFENFMHKMKKLVRSGKRPLAQVVKRLSEMKKQRELELKESPTVSTKPPNNAYVLEDGTCCEVTSAEQKDFLCRVYERPEALFTEPCDSRLLRVFIVNRKYTRMQVFPAERLTNSAIKLKEDETGHDIFMGLLHEF